jgi:hypothetical protein
MTKKKSFVFFEKKLKDICILDKVVHICKQIIHRMKQIIENIVKPIAATKIICGTSFTTTTGMMMGRMSMA